MSGLTRIRGPGRRLAIGPRDKRACRKHRPGTRDSAPRSPARRRCLVSGVPAFGDPTAARSLVSRLTTRGRKSPSRAPAETTRRALECRPPGKKAMAGPARSPRRSACRPCAARRRRYRVARPPPPRASGRGDGPLRVRAHEVVKEHSAAPATSSASDAKRGSWSRRVPRSPARRHDVPGSSLPGAGRSGRPYRSICWPRRSSTSTAASTRCGRTFSVQFPADGPLDPMAAE